MKLKSKIAIIVLLSFLAVSIFGYIYNYNKELNYEFNGVVQSIQYSAKGFPKISIKNTTYDFGNPHFLEYTGLIKRGDSLVKKAGSFEIKVIKGNIKSRNPR